MRVAYVCTDAGVPVFGRKGSSAHVQAVLEVLVRSGAQVHLVVARTGGPPPPVLAGVVVHELPRPVRRADDGAAREHAAVATDAAVAAVLDAVLASGPVDLVYERYSLWGRTATAWARANGTASLLEVNAPLVDEQRVHRGLVDEAGAEATARQAFSNATAVVCVSDAVTAWVCERTRDASRVRTVANGVDTRRTRPSTGPVTPSGADVFTVGFVGTLKPWHGVDVLVDALGRLVAQDASYRLLLVGDGPGAGELREQVVRLGLTAHVECTGAVEPAAVPGLLRRVDVAVAPYPHLDGFYFSPLKVYEYLAAGLPVVASDVGHLAEVLHGGRLGVLVPPQDPVALARAVADLRRDPVRRVQLRAAASHVAATEHDWHRVVERSLAGVGLSLAGDRADATTGSAGGG